MPRFMSREEWPLIAGGITAGVLTSALAMYLFVTGIGGGNGTNTLVSDTTVVVPRQLESPPAGDVADAPSGPLVGAQESGVRGRLRRLAVRTAPLEGPLSITARDVVLNEDGGGRFARAEVITARLRVEDVGRGDVILEGVVVRSPVIALREESGGGWNYEQVFAELLEGDGGAGRPGRKRTIQLRDVRIENGDVQVTRPAQRFAFRSVEGRLPLVVFSQEGVAAPYLRASLVNAQFVQAEPEANLAIEVRNGLFIFPEGTVRFDVEGATLDRTRFADLSGVWNPADPGYGVTATGIALGVDFADVRFMLPESFPETGTASFAWEVRPAAPNLTEVTLSDLDARTDGSRLLGSVTMRLGEEVFELLGADLRVDPLALALVERFTGPIPYGGALVGTIRGSGGDIRFDLDANLTTPAVAGPFTTGIVGRVRYVDGAIALQQLELDLQRVPLAALRAFAPSLPLSGTVTGVVSLTGPPNVAPLDLNVRLELGAGVALVEGRVDLTGAVASYNLSGRLVGVDLQSVMEPAVPPVTLSAGFSLVGSGFDPATMSSAIRLNGRFTGWETTTRDTISFAADIRGGTLIVERLVGSLATADLNASGNWRFVAPQEGAVTYALDVSSLRPFGPYIPVVGDSIASGSLRTAGTLSGTLERMRIAGNAVAGNLRVGGWQAQSITGDYDVTTGGGALPAAIVTAEGRGVVTPTAGSYREGTLSLRLAPPGLDFELNANRTDGGLVEVVATGLLPETGQREVRVERARFDLADDRWVLQRPATFRWTGGGPVYADGLEIRAERSDGRVLVDGRVLPLADIDATIGIASLPVGDVQRLLGRPVMLDGLLWADGVIRGGGDANTFVDVTFRVENGAFQQVPLQQLTGTLVHANSETRLDAQVVVDSAGRLDVDAVLPSRLRLGSDTLFALIDGVPLSGSIIAQNFAIAPLLAGIPQVRDATGLVNANVTLAGTADAPQVEGGFTLAGGSFRVPQLNQTFTDVTGEIGFDGRRLVIEDMRARSEGWLVIGGQVVLERLTEPVLDLTIALDDFEPVGVENLTDAAVWGEMSLTGPLDGLLLTGGIRVADGYVVIPELGGPSFRPELVDMTRPAALDTLQFEAAPAATDIMRNLTIRDLVVDVGTDTWFVAYQARVQLAGELIVNKTGDSYPIVGTLNGNRGQYTLIAGPIIRRFEITSAQVRFLGTPTPNPSIDITARRIVLDPSGRQLDVDVRITGTADNPTLQLAGGTPGQIAESELLSYLVFGQPSFALGEQLPGDQLLQQTYFGAFWELLAIELERSLGGLGLDIFQVRFGQGGFGGITSPTIVVGKQFRDDVFLTLETALAGLFGGESSSTWAIRLDWTFDRRSRLRLALEPVYRGRALRSSAFALPLQPPQQQLLIELRRRWTY
jgi:hypothetical protein